jgi:hypothetical protein
LVVTKVAVARQLPHMLDQQQARKGQVKLLLIGTADQLRRSRYQGDGVIDTRGHVAAVSALDFDRCDQQQVDAEETAAQFSNFEGCSACWWAAQA